MMCPVFLVATFEVVFIQATSGIGSSMDSDAQTLEENSDIINLSDLVQTFQRNFKAMEKRFKKQMFLMSSSLDYQKAFDRRMTSLEESVEEGIARLEKMTTALGGQLCDQERPVTEVSTVGQGTSVPVSVISSPSSVQAGIVFLRRHDGSEDFFRTWADYRRGFGDENSEFWLGLDRLNQITSSGQYKLLVNMTNWSGERRWAVYNTFAVGNESDGYPLTVGDFDSSSPAADSMSVNNGRRFSTRDRDQDTWDGDCAESRKGAWWYSTCAQANPTGLYKPAGYWGNEGIYWYNPNNDLRSLKTIVLTLKQM